MRIHHGIAAVAMALAGLLGPSSRPVCAASPDALAPLRQRTSDAVIAADLERIESLDRRLAVASGPDVWRRAKARALLAAAAREYQDNDRTGFDVAAYAEAKALAEQLAAGAPTTDRDNVPRGTPLAGSTRVRENLWTWLEALKRSEGFPCAAEALANAEVQLQWAGNEQVDQGDCRTSPHLADAERLLNEARVQSEACAPQPVVAQRPAPEPAPLSSSPPLPPVAPTPTAEELRIPRNVHFALDKYYLSATSREVIAGVARVLAKYPSIRVRLEGHTDSRASVAYNLRLSKNRVEAVRAAMVANGIAGSRITTAFKGESELKTSEDSNANFARNRRVEMVFVDSEGLEIKAEDQEQDLQLERAAPARAPAKRTARKR